VRTLDFWFDYSCPYAYLGSTQVEALARRTGATLTWCPMLLGGVFRAVGSPQNMMDVLSPAKARHNLYDMHRWAELFGVPLAVPSGHPFRTVEALRATLVTGCDPAVIHGFYRAYWIEGQKPSEPSTLRSVLASAGHDADAVMARVSDADVKDDLRRRTDQAIALGIFGAPTFIVDRTHLYWGQDRIDFVARALTGPVAAGEVAAL
jgi:2-hydroxychromene-2-carboxylate isomerase